MVAFTETFVQLGTERAAGAAWASAAPASRARPDRIRSHARREVHRIDEVMELSFEE
jgi:hypothetical protein